MNRGGGPPVIQLKDLYARRQERDTAKLRAYDEVLKQIMNKVHMYSQMPSHPTDITYEVPSFLVGVPCMDMQDAIVYIVFQLRSGGFEVRFTWPNLLYISWKSYEREYLMQNSPIFKSMIQSASVAINKPEVKKPVLIKPAKAETKKKSVSFGNGGAGSGAPKPKAAPLAALEYQPPIEFFKAVEAPKAASPYLDISKF
jgi:hypothetical protein